jgi:hypothetical protein
MTTWEDLTVKLPSLEAATHAAGRLCRSPHPPARKASESWEAVGMTLLADGRIAVLLKEPRPQ